MHFSRAQRNGLVVLFIIMLLAFSLPWFISYEKVDEKFCFEDFEQEIDAFYKQKEEKEKQSVRVLKPQTFNPNKCTKDDMIAMGLTIKQVSQIINYREKGGVFRLKSDFAKMYAIKDEDYHQLRPYILLPDSIEKKIKLVEKKTVKKKLKKEFKKVYINLNTAREDSLMLVKGIGNVFAKRIVQYREILGGFYNKSQLLDVYGIDEEYYVKIESQVFVEGNVEKLKINYLTAGALSKHPYISRKLAKEIVVERSFNGVYKDRADCANRNNISQELLTKLEPYLQF